MRFDLGCSRVVFTCFLACSCSPVFSVPCPFFTRSDPPARLSLTQSKFIRCSQDLKDLLSQYDALRSRMKELRSQIAARTSELNSLTEQLQTTCWSFFLSGIPRILKVAVWCSVQVDEIHFDDAAQLESSMQQYGEFNLASRQCSRVCFCAS